MDYPTEEELAEINELEWGEPTSQPTTSNHLRSSGNSFFDNSPQLSQISRGSNRLSTINKRLFDEKRTASTPFTNRLATIESPGLESVSATPYQKDHVGEQQIRKRRLDQLFGDIDDLDDEFAFEMANMPGMNNVKKMRTEDEIKSRLIEQILQARAESQAKTANVGGHRSRVEHMERLRKFKAQNLSETYPKWPCIPIVNNDTDRIYVRMHSEDFEDKQLNEINFQKGEINLLGDAASSIWDEAQQIVQKRMLNANTQALTIAEPPVSIVNESEVLWVDKYRPRSYLDLLSDEGTNRSLLTWLKMWDKAVFKREFKIEENKTDGPSNFFNKRTGKFEMGFKRRGKKNDLQKTIDEFGRPLQRIAVLCGPPGLGKTTLAHTIARHAGYAVRELNASDDRSLDAFKLALQNGTQMQTSVINPDKRPNCIILDEIDGAPTVSIDYLVRFVNEQTKETKEKGREKIGDEKNGKPKKAILRRPIICICNDIYTPSLRTLRQMAFVVTFPQLDSMRLAERLMHVCRCERLKADVTTLTALAEKSGNDVRSCISVLQFYAKSNKPITITDVIKANIGLKDKQRGLFDIWNHVFQIRKPRTKFETRANAFSPIESEEVCTSSDISLKTRMDIVLDIVHSGGDYERLTGGVYENYLSQKMPDPNMLGILEADDWFCFSDRLNAHIMTKQNYAVYSYLQFGFVIWHLLFSSPRLPKIKFPVQNYEYSQKVILQKTVRTAFLKKLSARVRCLGNGPTVIMDTVSFIRRILSPSLRFVSLQLLTNKERHDLRHTVQVMVDLGLHYTQLRVADGTYQYLLEPDINLLCQFIVPTDSSPLSYFNMQLIAREVEVEVMRRATPKQLLANEGSSSKKSTAPKVLQKFENHKQKLQPKAVQPKKIVEAVTKDFFGRIVTKQVVTDNSVDDKGERKVRIWYHYKEGFNNAVRKDVTIQKLL